MESYTYYNCAECRNDPALYEARRRTDCRECPEDRKAAASRSGWIRKDERLPERYVRVLVARAYEKNAPLRVEQGMLCEGGWWKVYGANVKDVRYWMPLPAPPEGERG